MSLGGFRGFLVYLPVFLFAKIDNSYTYIYPFPPHCYTKDRMPAIESHTLCFSPSGRSQRWSHYNASSTILVTAGEYPLDPWCECITAYSAGLPNDRHLDCFQSFVISNYVTMNNLVHKSF